MGKPEPIRTVIFDQECVMDEDYILAIRAARHAIPQLEEKLVGEWKCIGFGKPATSPCFHEKSWIVRRNKNSVRVYRNKPYAN